MEEFWSKIAKWPISWAVCVDDAFSQALSKIAEWHIGWAVCVGGARVDAKALSRIAEARLHKRWAISDAAARVNAMRI